MRIGSNAVGPLIRRVLAGHGSAMMAATVVSAIAKALALEQPLIAGRLVDMASSANVSTELALLLGGAFIVQICSEGASRYLFDRLGENVVFSERYRYARHLIDMPVHALDRERTGDLVSRGTADTTHLRELPRYIGQFGIGLCTLVVAVVLMLRIDTVLALIVTGVLAVAFPWASVLITRMQSTALANQRQIGNYGASLERALGAIRTVKLFGTHEYHAELIGHDAALARRAGTRLAVLAGVATPVVRIAGSGSLIVVLVLGGSRVADGSITVGELVTLFLLTLYTMGPMQDVYDGLMTARTIVGSSHRVTEILDHPTEFGLEHLSRVDDPHVPVSAGPVHVCANHLSFGYGDQLVLEDVSFTLQRNRIHALVGPSGAGKSTLLAQLCRFYEPDTGELLLDGKPYASYPLPVLRRRVALVEQDNPILYGTLRENLVMARPDATDDEVWAALRQVNLHEVIAQLPAGLETNVLDHGRSLSGGQRQRLAIARALLSPADLVLLDEPTAHLDRTNEYAMVDAIGALRGRRTVLVVAHRITTVQGADQILVMANGRILDQGEHHDLLRRSEPYRQLYQTHTHTKAAR